MLVVIKKERVKTLSKHIFIATVRPLTNIKHMEDKHDVGLIPAEEYQQDGNLPFTLPYVYEVFGNTESFLPFINELMDIGDIVETYEFWEGSGLPESINVPKEARTINLLTYTYKDEYGEYILNKKRWLEELTSRTYISHRSVTTFSKY